jgi:DNA-binding CsgD family transcriptional regulator
MPAILLHYYINPFFPTFTFNFPASMMRKLLIFIFLPLHSLAQNTIGLPDVINYSKQTYGGGLQNWDFKQDKNGIIYVANNEGLLSFDGRNWHTYPLPNKTIVRSAETGYDNKVYVGGQDEIGYFAPASNGQLRYHSIIDLLPAKDKSFGDVWDIISFENSIFFRSNNRIFRLNKGTITTFYAASEWSFLGDCNGRLYAHDYKLGLKVFENNRWRPIDGAGIVFNNPVTGILPAGKDSAIITTLKTGLFLLSAAGIEKLPGINNALFENERIYAAAGISKEWIALATSNSGVYITDLRGNIIQSFSAKEGLQNNNVLSIFLDRQRNLWLGLDNGIDLIAYNSAIKQINPSVQGGSGYAAIIHNNRLFMGTSNGLYSVGLQPLKDLSFSKGDFSPVNNTRGQTWGLAQINDQLLLGHHEGAFTIRDNNAQMISNSPGFWNFVPLPAAKPTPQLIAGSYKTLSFFDFKNGAFVKGTDLPGFEESCRFIALDENGSIWISHPYHGLYKISPKSDGGYNISTYTDKKGLPSTLNNHVYKIRRDVLVGTEKGVYVYDPAKDIFIPSAFYKKLLGNQSIRYLKDDKAGNTWFIHEKTLGVIDAGGKEPAVIYLPELNNKMLSGFEFIYPVDENNIFLAAEKGFLHINYEKYKEKPAGLEVQIRVVKIYSKKDSVLFGGFFNDINEKQIQDEDNIPGLSHTWKTIHLEFSSALFGNQENLYYSYRLKGFDDNWSEWAKRTEKEYTNLPAGKYVFEVKARNNLGSESGAATYSFRILPPWYQTGWAGASYLILLGLMLYVLYKWLKKKFRLQRLRYEEEQKRLLYIHELERSKTENELVALGNDKLQAEINFKNSELASSAMHLVKKGELIAKIKAEITQVIKGLENPQATAELKKMIKSLGDDDNMDREWENFSKHFDKVQSGFLVELKEKHPGITGNELKLSAYLRMNLSTKEIAQLMNISVRGVEIGRYRLRKKLQITSETSLFDYLVKIQTKP